MPLRDDWASARELIQQIDQAVAAEFRHSLNILLVDDASIEPCKPSDFKYSLSVVQTIRVLRLRRNLGHQRAIAVGLAFIEHNQPCDAVMVMDADGEDTPQGVVALLKAFHENHQAKAVFAARSRRSESLGFRVFYRIYKMLHLWLTGIEVKVGNFSILPYAFLNTLVVYPELWSHYAAAMFRSRLSFTTIPIARGSRIAGVSRMNFISLVTHGLSAISVFGDVVGARLLVASLLSSAIAMMGIAWVVAVRLFTSRAIPGWATSAAGTLAILAIQFLTVAASFTFLTLSGRLNFGFIPVRDSSLFIAGVEDVYHNV